MDDKDLQHLAAIVRDSDDAIIGKTLEGIITSWNRGAERIYGYTAEEAIGRTVAMLVPPDREDELPKILKDLTSGDGINRYDTLRVTKDGRLVNISLTVSPIRDAAGAIIAAFSIGRDVTAEKCAAAALQESARAYKLLMEQASDAILISYPGQPLIELNQRASDMLGYTREELLELRGQPSDLPEGWSMGMLHLSSDELLDGATVLAERSIRRKDGTDIIAELSTRRLDDGRIMTVARDITERKRAEEALRESEARLQSALDLAQLSPYEWDPQTGSLNWDIGLLRELWGLLPETSVNVDIFMAGVHPDDREAVQAQIAGCSDPEGDGLYDVEFRVINQQDKQERWVTSRGKTFFDGGLAVRHIGVAQDITERKQAEEALRRKEAQLSEAQEIAHVGSWQADLKTGEAIWSDELYSIFGVEPQSNQANFERFAEYVHPDDKALISKEMEHVREVGGSFEYEYRVFGPDGTKKVLCTRGRMILDKDGLPSRIVGTTQDITERMMADELIQFQAQVLDQVQAAVIATDMQGTVTHWNEYAEKLYGWPRTEALGLPIRDLTVGPTDADLAAEIMTEVMVRGSWQGEFIVQRKDGSTFPAYVVDTVVHDKVGQPIGIAGISVDLTERKEGEEAIRAGDVKFRAIFENTLDAVFISDDMGRYVDVNPAACKLLGLPPEALLGHSYTEFPGLNPSTDLRHLDQQVSELGRTSGYSQFTSAEGEAKDIEFFSIANFIPGYHLSVAHDLSERKQAEQEHWARESAEQANRAKSAFLSRMSHELRTPLNAILGFGQLLQMDAISAEQQESVQYIMKAGMHLLSLINEVLEIARIEEGTLGVSIEPVFVRDVIQESMDLVQTLATHRKIELSADVAWMDHCYVLADRQRLQQVLMNLLANAIKYNRDGGTVNISCNELGGEADSTMPMSRATGTMQLSAGLRILVNDTGPGLSPEKVDLLFTPFERVGAEQSEIEGTGLGLSISKHLVEAMGGIIGVESTVGVGSTFWLDLCLADEQSPSVEFVVDVPQDNPLDPRSGEQPRPRTLLYIEDNVSNLRLIEGILKKWPDLNLITALHGRMGLDMANKHRPDVILLDLHLPDMQGDEVLRRLQQDPRTSGIPVVILSADANPQRAEKLLQAGAQAYLTKPFDVSHLHRVLADIRSSAHAAV